MRLKNVLLLLLWNRFSGTSTPPKSILLVLESIFRLPSFYFNQFWKVRMYSETSGPRKWHLRKLASRRTFNHFWRDVKWKFFIKNAWLILKFHTENLLLKNFIFETARTLDQKSARANICEIDVHDKLILFTSLEIKMF